MTEDANVLGLVKGAYEAGLLTQTQNNGTEKYYHIKTEDVVSFFEKRGWTKVGTSAKCYNGKMDLSQFHVTIMEDRSRTFHQGYPRIVIGNSYNSQVRFSLSAGFFNTICANGLVVAEQLYVFKRKHLGLIVLEELLTEEYQKIAAAFDKLAAQITRLKSEKLTARQKFKIAYSTVRSAKIATANRVIDFRDFFNPLREEEKTDNKWTFLNVIQEKLMRTGIKVLTREVQMENGKIKVVKMGRDISLIKDNRKRLEVNKILWDKVAA